ncbi:hypothetical protein HKBW3S34_02539, partial [Candidatus Hakubella thermalkaliphila]
MHLKRLIVAAILLPLIYFYITKLPAEYFLFLLVIVAAAAQHEFYSMYNVKGLLRYSGIIMGILMLFTVHGSRFTVHSPYFIVHSSQFTHHFSQLNAPALLFHVAFIRLLLIKNFIFLISEISNGFIAIFFI